MDINHLNCFITVAQTLNFSEAARRSYVSQSTVSRCISDLEREYGVKFFTRTNRDVILTDEGKTLLPYAIEIVSAFSKSKTILSQMRDGGNGRLSVGCDATSLRFPSECIAAFCKKYPRVSVELKMLDSADRSQAILGGEYDICFMPRDMVPESSEIDTIATHTEQLVIVSSSRHTDSSKKELGVTELSGKRLLMLSEATAPILYMEVIDLLRTFHISPEIESGYSDISSLGIALASGLGVSILPSSLADFISNDFIKKYPVADADTAVSYVMAWAKRSPSPVARLFISSAKEMATAEDNVYGL